MDKKWFSVNNPSIQMGFIGGLLVVLFFSIVYVLGSEKYFLNPLFHVVFFALVIGFAVAAPIREKKLGGGYITFPNALFAAFITILIIGIFYNLFNYIHYNFIDPEFAERNSILLQEKMRESMAKQNVPSEDIEKRIQIISEQNANITFTRMLIAIVIWSVLGFIGALIIGAIVKKETPANLRESE